MGIITMKLSRLLKKNSATKIILANTIKGIGLGKLENTLDSHYLNN